jgi:hypothetical protein
MECKCYVAATVEKVDALLSKINTGDENLSGRSDIAATFRQVLAIQHELKQLLKRHDEVLYEMGRQFGENVKAFAIQAPPDKPALQTVPWELGNPSTVIPPKGALTRRTADAIPTVQKTQKKK